MEDRIFQLLVNENEISWKSIILDLVKKEDMDPWNINISLLAQKYIDRIKELKQSDLKVSGKVLLAAAILLRIKSKRLVGEDLSEFDRLLSSTDMDEDEFYDELEQELRHGEAQGMNEKFELNPRTPLPRKRKVSVYDLVQALEKALEVKKRRIFNEWNAIGDAKLPERKFDITKAITNLYDKIKFFFFKQKQKKLKFSDLVQSKKKEDKVYTFIPLLHLSNEDKVDLYQEEHFSDFDITMPNKISEEEQ
ncbi:segregation/condensation protein A [Candidatus Woesearchaeota archaeon]|nr:segregation/condensation protein A [Candidatus Woesearchaeota archaeon]